MHSLHLIICITWALFLGQFALPYSFDDPVLPKGYESWASPFVTPGYKIPRHIWYNVGSFKTAPELTSELPAHLIHIYKMSLRERNWTVHLEDETKQNFFMETHFANTSVLWAFHLVNEKIGVSKSDIWRYAQLLLYGGSYFDEDSTVDGSLEAHMRPNDELILTKEPNLYSDECYDSDFHMSDVSLSRRFSKDTVNSVTEHRSLANWGFFAAPKHPVLERVLKNVVEVIRLEYFRLSALKLPHFSFRWKTIMCVTGPIALTASVKEVLLETPTIQSRVRMEPRDFSKWGGRFKIWAPDLKPHYMVRMQKESLSLLQFYRPTPLRELELFSITRENSPQTELTAAAAAAAAGSTSNETAHPLPFPAPPPNTLFFVILNGKIRDFDSDGHAKMFGFVPSTAVTLDPAVFSSLPRGDTMPKTVFGSNEGLSRIAHLEGRLICTVNDRHRRSYFMLEGNATQTFLHWDHLVSATAKANHSIEDAVQVDASFVSEQLPVGGFYRLETLEEDLFITVEDAGKSQKPYYVFKNHTGGYCHFRDLDHLQSTRFKNTKPSSFTQSKINSTRDLGEC